MNLFDMRAGLKLLGQILAVVPLLVVGAYAKQFVLFGFVVELGWLGVPWTVAWVVLGINALNLIDGMDGLASTIGIAAARCNCDSRRGHRKYSRCCRSRCRSQAPWGGFLAHNLPPARIYLGDCGSMVIGLVLATLTMRVAPQFEAPNLTVMLGLLFIPLYDTVLAIIRRGLNGKGIMAADRGHVHHRLLDRGFGVWGTLALLAGLESHCGLHCVACCHHCPGVRRLSRSLGALAILCAQLESLRASPNGWLSGQNYTPSECRPKPTGSRPYRTKRPQEISPSATLATPAREQNNSLGFPKPNRAIDLGSTSDWPALKMASAATAGKKYVELLG